jgi:hypothetical protein
LDAVIDASSNKKVSQLLPLRLANGLYLRASARIRVSVAARARLTKANQQRCWLRFHTHESNKWNTTQTQRVHRQPSRLFATDNPSLGLIRLVAFLENDLGIRLEDEETIADNFVTLRQIGQLLATKNADFAAVPVVVQPETWSVH